MRSRIPIEQRFWTKVKKTNGCWLWTGQIDHHGYGRIRLDQQIKLLASRVSWEIHNGKILDGLLVLHKCDNPSCVNPDHLFLGTHKDNVADMIAKGRRGNNSSAISGERNHNTVLTWKIVMAIRKEFARLPKRYGVKRELGRKYGMTGENIHSIVTYKTWRLQSSPDVKT